MVAKIRQRQVNNSTPANARAKVGDAIADLIAQSNIIRTRSNSSMLSNAGLAIKAGSSAIVKAGTAFAALAAGSPVHKAANTDMAALVGTLATAKSAVWAFYIDAAGTLTTSAKSADAASDAAAIALLPATPDDKAMIGFILVNNATGSNFVGGTTALDTASLTVTYFNTTGPAPFISTVLPSAIKDLESR